MDVEDYARFLSHLPIFKGLNPREIAEIARAFEMRPYNEGDLFCVEGDLLKLMGYKPTPSSR